MCGIIGYAGHRPAVPVVVEGLRRLEYRGYDSAGVAFVRQHDIHVVRAMGKLAALEEKLAQSSSELSAMEKRVNGVAPGYIRTRRTSEPLADPDYLDEVLLRTPMGRIGEPEDVAAAVAFLCLPAAAYITGECIAVDGGFLRHGF